MSLILCYQGVVRFCNQFDDTPRWATVFFPNIAVAGQRYTIQVRYQDSNPTQLIAKAKLLRKSGRAQGELKANNPVVNVQNRDRTSFVFDVPTDPNVSSMQFSVSNLALPEVQRDPGKPLHPFIKSQRIKVIAQDSNSMVNFAHQSNFDQILGEAFSKGYWKVHRGDPTFMGWTLTFLYLVLAFLCICSTGINDKSQSRPLSTIYAWFWWLMTGLIILIGINKQLDLQLLLADVGRAYTKVQGWYEQRKPAQIQILALCATAALGTIEWIGYNIRKAPKTTWTAGLGFIVLILVILLKGVSLHTIEHTLSRTFLGIHLNEFIECIGILCIGLSAVLYNLTNRHEVNYVIQ